MQEVLASWPRLRRNFSVPPLDTALFDYELPPRLIAQTPAARRDQSRLLVVDRAAHTIAHHTFAELPQFLRAGDTLFRNNAAVLPARLHAQRPTGGQVECFLLRPLDGESVWRCLVRPGKKLPAGATFAHPSGAFTGEIVSKDADGSALVRFATPNDEPITAIANRLGDVPLPPYIERSDASRRTEDLARYQTVYADRARQVAVAAPTAGLHFTPELLATLSTQGIRTADVTLHVGLGTFKPITTETIEAHAIHRERYELPVATQRALFPPLAGRRIAVGTTTVRSVEHFLSLHSAPLNRAHVAEADLFIFPPRTFCGVDALITNFHQPRSTLLCLVAAFLTPGSTDGIAWIREIYAGAIARDYRFFSYGDAMLVL
jgi:S-adenosylmethionine:tRNA ribosyltransferase-isomerase